MLAVDDLNNWVGRLGEHPQAKTRHRQRHVTGKDTSQAKTRHRQRHFTPTPWPTRVCCWSRLIGPRWRAIGPDCLVHWCTTRQIKNRPSEKLDHPSRREGPSIKALRCRPVMADASWQSRLVEFREYWQVTFMTPKKQLLRRGKACYDIGNAGGDRKKLIALLGLPHG